MTPTGFDSGDTTSHDDSDLGNSGQSRAAESGAATHRTGSHGEAIDPDLARIVAAWAELPEAIRRGMLALVESAGL
jgi:hypothetical protein